jgi:hypothetical protein
MRAPALLFALFATVSSPTSTEAQRRYTVYKTNEFGHKSALSQPEAFIEEDPLSGDLKVYEPGVLGLPDRVKGPTYIIENDSLGPLSPNLERLPRLGDTLHSHRDHDEDCRHHHHHEDDTDDNMDDMDDMAEDW